MIKILDHLPEGVLGFETEGKVTADEYQSVLEPTLRAAVDKNAKLRMVVVIGGDFGIAPGALWEDVKTGIKNWSAWERIALVTDHEALRTGLHMFAWLTPGEAKAFPLAERVGTNTRSLGRPGSN